MKSLIYSTVFLQSLVSAIAIPASAPETADVTAAVEDRGLFNLWNPGYKPYKYQLYSPGKPGHKKYLCEKPYKDGYPTYLGYKDDKQYDFQYYLTPGYGNNYGYNEYKGGKTPDPYPREVILTGEKGYEYISPVYNPPEYKYPDKWVYKYKEWYITPLYKILAWLEITLSYFKQVHYWQPPKGYKWVYYDDGKGGYDVKAWDGYYPISQPYYETQIVVEAQYQKWGFSWK